MTGQPDWASVTLRYRGAPIDREGLLRYLVSFRDHAEFHEQCVERIFNDVLTQCAPQWLVVEARYTSWRPGHQSAAQLGQCPDAAVDFPRPASVDRAHAGSRGLHGGAIHA